MSDDAAKDLMDVSAHLDVPVWYRFTHQGKNISALVDVTGWVAWRGDHALKVNDPVGFGETAELAASNLVRLEASTALQSAIDAGLRAKAEHALPFPQRASAVFATYAANVAAAPPGPSSVQASIAAWCNRAFGAVPVELHALGVAEELGELAEAFLSLPWAVGRLAHAVVKHRQGTRGLGDPAKFRERAADALGDLMIFAAQAATLLRLDLWTIFEDTAMAVMTRTGDSLPAGASK